MYLKHALFGIIAQILFSTADAAVVPCSSSPTDFFSQAIDHSHPSKGSFRHQYQLITQYYKPGGPILFYQSAENPSFECGDSSALLPWAKSLGAVVASLEHRFFGQSLPNNISNLMERYETLTLDNVMSDAVTFVQLVKEIAHLPNDTKVIAAGGSYGAFLAAVYRLNHPEAFYGSVAWAAPVRNLGENATEPYAYLDYISNVYHDLSPVAAIKIKSALAKIADDASKVPLTGEYDTFASKFNFCGPSPQNSSDLDNMQVVLSQSYLDNARFSYGYRSTPGTPFTSIEKLINETITLDDAYAIANRSVQAWWINEALNNTSPCITWTGDVAGEIGVQYDPYTYLECKYNPTSHGQFSPASLFPSSIHRYDLSEEKCKALFNISISDPEELEKRYRFSKDDILQSERILFTMGQFDGTTTKSPTFLQDRTLAQRDATRILWIPKGAHGEDSFDFESIPVKDTVRYMQDIELNIIGEWLGLPTLQ